MPHPTVVLSEQLIALKSITPDDGGCQDIIASRLEKIGFKCKWFDKNGTRNLWARFGKSAPLLVFAGHTDVVPTGPLEQWQFPPFSPTQSNGKLYGRGAADMKSSLAAFVVSIENFLSVHPEPKGSIALLITSDEEGSALSGTRYVVEQLERTEEHIDFCIVGEPTCQTQFGDTIKNGRRGSLSGKLIIHGIQGHIAYPHLARNPIHQALPALLSLTQMSWDEGNEYFQPTSFQISNIQAGTGAGNVIPGTLTVDFNLRFSTASTAEDIQTKIREILDTSSLSYEISWALSTPYLTTTGALTDAISHAIIAETGITPNISTSGGTSDGRFISKICKQIIEFGPLNESIHKIDEHVEINDLIYLTDIHRRTMEILLAP